jgi:dihydropyrimidine dehydrogenase (NAD+) subunit PreT
MGDIQAGRMSPKACADSFRDIAAAFDRNEARVAAERCLFCHDAPCVTACPTSIDIPLFIRQIANGQPVPAAKTILDANIMGAMCARVCPTENLCEGACVKVAAEDNPVEIGRLQRFATDAAMTAGRQFYRKGAATGQSAAVVGAGPAGLACAHALARAGHAVAIYEAAKKGGGLNEFGIAAYKATDGIAQRELDYILSVGGIDVSYGKALGRDVTLAELRAKHDAVFLGMGLGGTNALGLGTGIPGIVDAVDFISKIRQSKDKSKVPVGRNVVVIGGGMTAIDAATQAKLIGAESATIVYRRGRKDMGASHHEQEVAQTRGVLIRYSLRPVKLKVEGKGKDRSVAGVTFEYTVMKAGKLEGTGETTTIPCDQVLVAIGQTLLTSDLKDAGLDMDKGRIKVGKDRRTSLPGVWAGGDCAAGGLDLTVAAVEDGKIAARGMNALLASKAKKAV